jgi:hypothetical protein
MSVLGRIVANFSDISKDVKDWAKEKGPKDIIASALIVATIAGGLGYMAKHSMDTAETHHVKVLDVDTDYNPMMKHNKYQSEITVENDQGEVFTIHADAKSRGALLGSGVEALKEAAMNQDTCTVKVRDAFLSGNKVLPAFGGVDCNSSAPESAPNI